MIQGLPKEEPWVLETTWLECKNEIGELWDGYLLHAKRNIFKLGVNSSPMPPACPIPHVFSASRNAVPPGGSPVLPVLPVLPHLHPTLDDGESTLSP